MTQEAQASIDTLIERLCQRKADIVTTLELMHGYTQQVDAAAHELENPQAIRDYLSFFTGLFSRAVTDCERIAAELTTEGIKSDHVVTLKGLMGAGTVEQKRCLQFRDKWINKPLPHESMRPLLNDISVTTRDQLTAFRDLLSIASGLVGHFAPTPAPPREERSFGRRDLFTRFLKR